MSQAIIKMSEWASTPPGVYLNGLEQAWFDTCVENAFGFHALQLGAPWLQTLRCNRIPQRWLFNEVKEMRQVEEANAVATDNTTGAATSIATNATNTLLRVSSTRLHVQALFSALPLEERSVDLATCPHTLELCANPHAALREIHRILVPEGRLLLTAFNPHSLWGLAHKRSRLYARLGLGTHLLPAPGAGKLSLWRVRDWLRLLGFEVESVHFCGYRPAFQSSRGLQRSAFLDSAGARCWRFWGAVYAIQTIKRQPNIRLSGIHWKHYSSKRKKPFLRPVATPSNSQKNHEIH